MTTSNRTWNDWLLLFALVAMWGSSFMFNRVAVASLPPWTVVAGRIGIAALVLTAVVYATGRRLPPPGRVWAPFVLIAAIGNAIPFYLITWGQQVVESALAGILMAVMPLATLVLAHFLIAGERMTRPRVAGFVIGFGGIVLLMGPAALAGAGGDAMLVYQLAVLGGALCYALQSVLTRLIIRGDVMVAAAATLIVASLMVVPAALWLDRPWTLSPRGASVAAVVWLGVAPTALATVLYFQLIRSAGPTFMSLVNYLSPGVAVLLGLVIMGEHPLVTAYFGLALILAGIAVAQRRPAAAP